MDSLEFDPSSHSHRRFNPLTEEYILVSPHRGKRPWHGQVEPPQPSNLPEYDPKCYLCPGNTRVNGDANPKYDVTYVFENDYAALAPAPAPTAPHPPHPLLVTEPVHGRCDVLIFHPRHDLTLARLKPSEIEVIIEEWKKIYVTRSVEQGIRHVQIFENKGAMMGCSNPHPHGQVWSQSAVPTIPSKELSSLRRYATSTQLANDAPKGPHGSPCLLCDYAHFEASEETGVRVVTRNKHWIALVPWWATWPFEVLLLPYGRHISSILDLEADEQSSLAEILSEVTIRYDNLFSCSFAYSMGIHQAPISRSAAEQKDELLEEADIAHIHFHFSPPLLRSANVRKFLVGYELMAEAQRDLTPEQGAARLRGCSTSHYVDALETES